MCVCVCVCVCVSVCVCVQDSMYNTLWSLLFTGINIGDLALALIYLAGIKFSDVTYKLKFVPFCSS